MVSGKDRLLALWVRLRSILSGRDWIYLFSLLGPLMVYNLTLKALRIHSQQEVPERLSAVGLMRSDLLFNVGYALLWIGLCSPWQGGGISASWSWCSSTPARSW